MASSFFDRYGHTMTSARFPLLVGCIAGALAVVSGAFGTHALRGTLDDRMLAAWHTAVDYQFFHALALLATGLLSRTAARSTATTVAAVAFAVGIVLFCGSVYVLALGGPRWLGVVTPVGGLAFIAGWVALAIHVARDVATQ